MMSFRFGSFRLRPQGFFKLLGRRRRRSPDLWQFGLAAGGVIGARTLLAISGKLTAAEARRMVEEKRSALARAQLAYTKAMVSGRTASAARDYFDVYRRAVKSNRKRLDKQGRRRLGF